MWESLQRAWRIRELRMSFLYIIGMLILFRAIAHIPLPGVNVEVLNQFLSSNQLLGLLNMFSGGTMKNFSIAMLGVAPYITASIVFQLLAMVVPRLEEMAKDGEMGQKKIAMYTRIATVPLAMLQGFALLELLRRSPVPVISDFTPLRTFATLMVVSAGTIFLMWLGELMTEKKLGNGISLLIFAGIVSGLPQVAQNLYVNYDPTKLTTYILYVIIAVLTIVGVVYVSEGQRNIPVSYARNVRPGMGGSHAQSHLPLRVNTAGVIPIIFAVSLMLFPPTVAQFFVVKGGQVGAAAQYVINLFHNNQLFYGIMYFILVFGFTYFYTAIVFEPKKIAENLQRQGGFIPGIRPGTQTEEYIAGTMNKLLFVGALFLGTIAVLPVVVQGLSGSQSMQVGGTSILIVVSVAIEIAKQINARITMHEYDHI